MAKMGKIKVESSDTAKSNTLLFSCKYSFPSLKNPQKEANCMENFEYLIIPQMDVLGFLNEV